MAVASDSYGTAEDVARRVPAYTNTAGEFDPNTAPPLGTVEAWIDEISDTINVILDYHGEDVPATDRLATALGGYVVREVVDRVNATKRAPNKGPQEEDSPRRASIFDAAKAAGKLIEMYGSGSIADSIGFREFDESGDEVSPIFQREAFGGSFKDWDSD